MSADVEIRNSWPSHEARNGRRCSLDPHRLSCRGFIFPLQCSSHCLCTSFMFVVRWYPLPSAPIPAVGERGMSLLRVMYLRRRQRPQ